MKIAYKKRKSGRKTRSIYTPLNKPDIFEYGMHLFDISHYKKIPNLQKSIRHLSVI